MMTTNRVKALIAGALVACTSGAWAADAAQALRDFVRDAKSGRAEFTQVVTSPDGAKKKTSSGSFEFLRPNRFRFAYMKPFEQLIVGDGTKVWIYDTDLNQATSRPMTQALGATPAALLAGNSVDKDFDLQPQPSTQGIDWVQATPRGQEAAFQSLRIGFRGKALAAIELVDGFGQRSRLDFSDLATNMSIPAEQFRFVPPKGADVIEQ